MAVGREEGGDTPSSPLQMLPLGGPVAWSCGLGLGAWGLGLGPKLCLEGLTACEQAGSSVRPSGGVRQGGALLPRRQLGLFRGSLQSRPPQHWLLPPSPASQWLPPQRAAAGQLPLSTSWPLTRPLATAASFAAFPAPASTCSAACLLSVRFTSRVTPHFSFQSSEWGTDTAINIDLFQINFIQFHYATS